MPYLFKTFVLFFCFILVAEITSACSCMANWKTVKEGSENVDFAAEGKVIAIDSVLISNSWYIRAKFVITKKFKSSQNIADTVNILSGGSAFMCSISHLFYYSNALDLRLLIFADVLKSKEARRKEYVHPNTYYTWKCLRPRIVHDRKEYNLTDSL